MPSLAQSMPQVGLAQDGSSTYTPLPTYTKLFIDQQPLSLINLVPVAMRLKNCQSDYKPSSLTHSRVAFPNFQCWLVVFVLLPLSLKTIHFVLSSFLSYLFVISYHSVWVHHCRRCRARGASHYVLFMARRRCWLRPYTKAWFSAGAIVPEAWSISGLLGRWRSRKRLHVLYHNDYRYSCISQICK